VARRRAEDDAAGGMSDAPEALAGLRVGAFTHRGWGATCGMVLADLGAGVL
jgi:crotonobetainyl-CoA:carnitine CoA-transferase CaiB-like acyl-CoA transferase